MELDETYLLSVDERLLKIDRQILNGKFAIEFISVLKLGEKLISRS